MPKFVLIDSSDHLNISSSNALLKVLEEPKKISFLISHQPSLLLPTIKSRCLKLNLSSHNLHDFQTIIENKNISQWRNIKIIIWYHKWLAWIYFDLNFDDIQFQFDELKYSITENELFSISQKI